MFILVLTAIKAFLIERIIHRGIATPAKAGEFASAKRYTAILTALCVFFNILYLFQILRNFTMHGVGGRELWLIWGACLAIELYYCVWRAGVTTLSQRYYDDSDKRLLKRMLLANVCGASAILYSHAVYRITLIFN